MTTPINKRWLLEHGFSNQGNGKYQADYPCKVDSITIYLHNWEDFIDFWIESDDIYINGTLREGTAEELQRYIDVCNLSDDFLDAYRLNKKGDDDGNAIIIPPIAEDGVFLKDEAGICAASYDRINPIPLTAEILEKNGFKREDEERGFSEPYCVYVNDDFQYVIKVYPKDEMDRYSRLEIGEYDDYEYMSLLINYVHELQHALRLVGIEKEIEL